MRRKGSARGWLAAAVGAAALMLVPGPAQADGPRQPARGYLNLHQCAYYSTTATNFFTTVVPSRDGRFAAGTKVSNTAETKPTCGAGDGNYRVVPERSGVKALDLSAGRYLNLHQCVYYSSALADHYTTVVPGSDRRFAAGSRVSNTADTTPSCGPGGAGYTNIPLLSGVKALDLTAGRYVNLHQCVYFSTSAVNHFTTVVPSRDGRFMTGTKVSNTAETSPSCGPGDGNYDPIALLSGVKALAIG
ncbi:hypothetical protein KQY30_04870 [Streptomyces sp. GMY02]|uniref:hypothetical protein n=1 Tax=Streptomyces sp. GMY02 TaxID=1333528 RepID=UPI001C2CC0F9|nr:hypothetical protein [Streptomyces sp. GMY02]QXE33715.1 hypothetical protein KQY30_04870 [Streptomyces sp. GMY02]